MLSGVADCSDEELEGAVIFCSSKSSLEGLHARRFGLCLTTVELADGFSLNGAVAATASPRLAFARLGRQLYSPVEQGGRKTVFDPSSRIHETAFVAGTASVGTGTVIGAHVYIGPGVVIGDGCLLEPGVVITHALLGKNITVSTGAAIGQAGFGFVPSGEGPVAFPQLGRVILEDDVCIGANSTIDRGALNDTVIGQGSKIDNLVHIAHNVRLGRNCIIAAQTGISGGCILGDNVFAGGQVGLADHLTIGDNAKLAAGCGLMRDVPPGEKWGGRPGRRASEWLRETATLAKISGKRNTGQL